MIQVTTIPMTWCNPIFVKSMLQGNTAYVQEGNEMINNAEDIKFEVETVTEE